MSQAAARKFLFDAHSFDEEVVEVVEEPAEPPPPTYSEEELAAARAQAFAQGQAQGRGEALEEAQAAEERAVSRALEAVNANLLFLLEAEAARAARYEAEAVRLALAALERLFPALAAAHGLAEVKAVAQSVLDAHQQAAAGTAAIALRVHPDHAQALADLTAGASICVAGDPALGPADCYAAWADGGAVRDAGALAEAIAAQMCAALASAGQTGDDARDG